MDAPTEIIAAQPDRVTRSPTDVLRLAVAVAAWAAVALVGWLFGDAVVGFSADLLRGLDALPDWFAHTLIVAGQLLGLGLLLGGLWVVVAGRRWSLLGSGVVAAGMGVALLAVARPLVDTDEVAALVDAGEVVTLVATDEVVSAAAVAAVTAAVTALAPWIPRWWRRVAWALVLAMAVTRFLGAPLSFDTVTAVLAGWVAGAATVVVLGAPSRRPTGEAIADGLRRVGVPLARLEQADLDARGSTPYFATATDGSRLFVKALGDDERSADLLFRLYRRVQPHDLGDERPFSSLRRTVEHEALVALAARDLGVRTPRLVTVATAEPAGYVLAYEAIAGRSLDRLNPEEFTDQLLVEVWAQLWMLRSRRIAHRDLRLANVFRDDDGRTWIIDFGFSELAASDLLLANDMAELLASSASQVGPQRAVAGALAVVDAPTLATAVDRLRPAMLSGATRAAMKAEPGLLDALRSEVLHQVDGATATAPPAG